MFVLPQSSTDADIRFSPPKTIMPSQTKPHRPTVTIVRTRWSMWFVRCPFTRMAWPWGGEITLHGVNELAPGSEAVITVRLPMPTHDPLQPGWTFRLLEGKRLVGHAELL